MSNDAKQKILVVDDEPGFVKLMTEFFGTSGYEAMGAYTCEQAINLFKKHRPKVVLLDFNMPGLTGENFLPMLQSLDPMVRAIVVTGCIAEEVENKFKGLGYFAFFEKDNLSLDNIKKKVDEALSY